MSRLCTTLKVLGRRVAINLARLMLPILGQPKEWSSSTCLYLSCIYRAPTMASAPPREDPATIIPLLG